MVYYCLNNMTNMYVGTWIKQVVTGVL